MRAVDILRKKRDGEPLERREIEAFVHGVTAGDWPEYQAAALLMAIVLRGMNARETADLTRAMVESGSRLDWSDLPGPKIDKHSTGGVGDKTSLVVAPLAAACGCVVPMMSGRGLGHTGGTLDKLEAIPGFRTQLSLAEMRTALVKIGCIMVGQTRDVAPADKKLYALRDVTATVESIPLITASILSKKIAAGIDGLIMDVKCGTGAFMKTRADARLLAESIVATGASNNVRTHAVVTAMNVPLGRAIGNALEVREAIDTLRGNGPRDLETFSVALAARMLQLAGLATSEPEAEANVRAALFSGRGLGKLRELIETQGGDPRAVDDATRLPTAPKRLIVRASKPGYVVNVHAEFVGLATMLLGAGRDRVEDMIDPAVGAVILAHRGEQVKAGDGLVEVHYGSESLLPDAVALLNRAWQIGEVKPAAESIVLEEIK